MDTRPDTHAPTFVPATAARVLAVLQDQYRHAAGHDPEFLDTGDLTAGTTVARWLWAHNLSSTRRLAAALNRRFHVDLPVGEWAAASRPPRHRTVADLCDLVARHATLPTVRPLPLLGRPCRAAGAFLTVRQYLAEAGADVRDLAPSTPVAAYVRRHPDVFLTRLGLLAPGALPTFAYRPTRGQQAVAWLTLAVIVAGVVLGARSQVLGGVPAVGRVALAVWTGWVAVAAAFALLGRLWPVAVTFGDLRTFRDVARRVAAAAAAAGA